ARSTDCLRNQAKLTCHGTPSGYCVGGGKERVAHTGDVLMVKDVKGLSNELKFCFFRKANGTGNARIQSDDGRHVEGIASEAWRPLVAAVAVCIEIGVDERGIGFSALSVEDACDLPALGQSLHHTVVDALSVVQFPHAAENKPVAHVVVAV